MQERWVVAPLTTIRHRAPLLLAAIAALVVAADQATKSWAEHALADRSIHIAWTLDLNLTLNAGVAFGLGKGVTPFLIVAAVVVLFLVVGLSGATETVARAVAMGLLVGGAVGNLVDRIFRSHGGAVVDFIDFGWWPVFNVADIAVTCGVILLVLTSWGRQAEQPA